MQTIYYNFSRKYLCDASGAAVSELPEITFAEKPTWRIIPVDDSGTMVMPTGIATYRAAVKFDFHSATATAARTMNGQITAGSSGIDVQLNANTANFLTSVDGQETRDAFFELCGLDSDSDRVFYLSFRVRARMILDPDLDNNLPEEVVSNYLDRNTADVLLAQKTDNTDFTALSGRVTAAETALPGKAASADAVQPGTVLAFAGAASDIPAGYLLCNGAAVDPDDYPALYAAIGNTYAPAEPETGYFYLPDLRGRFLRGLGGNSAELGVAQGDAIRNLTGQTGTVQSSVDHEFSNYGTGIITQTSYGTPNAAGTSGSTGLYRMNFYIDASLQVPTAAENRPVNYAVNYIIKY